MKLRYILLMIGIFVVLSLILRPSITGYVVQDRFLISDVKVSAEKFEQEVKVEQFDDYDIKLDDALYYFNAELDYEQEINYILIEFMVDNSQAKDVGLYFYDQKWKELDVEFVKTFGRYDYYQGKSESFGLFGVKAKEKVLAVKVAGYDLIFFGLIPVIILILLFSVLSYGFVMLIQKHSYRTYLLLKRILVGFVKFGLSLGIVVMILDLVSIDKAGSIGGVNLIYYAVIPLLILSLLSNFVLNLILYVRRLIKYNRVYKIFRNSFLLFVFILSFVVIALNRFVPESAGSLTRNELILFGLIPVILISVFVIFVFYFVFVLARRVLVNE